MQGRAPKRATPSLQKRTRGPQNLRPQGESRGWEPVEDWNLSRLTGHQRQEANFHELSDEELGRLASDLELNGQRTPVEVTPDGRVIDGHQRLRAARRLGWKTIRVIVRSDLARDEAAIERRMIEANLNRRQLDVLDRVRLARRMLEIKLKREPGGLTQCNEQGLSDRIGDMLGMSGRQVQRYLNILNAPMEVQRALSAKTLPMNLAEKVARLEEAAKVEIAKKIKAGGDPAQIVISYLPEAARAEIDPDKEYEHFLKAATQAVEALDGRVERVRGGMDLDPEIETLKQAGSLIARLIARHKNLKKLRAETLRGFGMSEI